ncbi:MAG: cell division protein FtsQ/DivIB [Lachnospiraceae bacterium]|nr:cell division protein FtsQ/DivIB [Lachnospiraceae bacterium]
MKKRTIILIGAAVFLLALGAAAAFLLQHYKVTTVYVEGSAHYTNEEIMDLVMTGELGDNSLYLALKYKNKGIDNVPFVETMDVDILAPDTIRITVYEKAMAGYIEYLGRYMYFDRDGIIVEASEQRTSGIPQVTGLSFDHVVMYEKLPVENTEIFADILDITQLLNKYGIQADKIQFDKSMHKTLYFGEARVSLGSNDNIGEKIMKLKAILPELEGKKGLLRMDNYSEEMKNITFELDQEIEP